MSEHRMHTTAKLEGAAAVTVNLPRRKAPSRRREDVYPCGECGMILAREIAEHALAGVLVRCPNCGSFNRP